MDGPYREPEAEATQDDADLVVLRTFDAPHDAALVAAYLESEGIAAFVSDDVVLGMNPLWNTAMGHVKLRVRVDHAEDADYLVERYERRRKARAKGPKAERRAGRLEARATARRALSAAVFGLFLCPGLAHLYAILLATPVDVKLLDRRGSTYRMVALGISYGVLAAFVVGILVNL